MVVVSLWASALVVGSVTSTGKVGPGIVRARVGPSLHPNTSLVVPPLGAISVDSHRSPVVAEFKIDQLDLDAVQRILTSDSGVVPTEQSARSDVVHLLLWHSLRVLGAALMTGAVVGAAVRGHHHIKLALLGAGTAVVGATVALALTWLTFNVDSFKQPTYTGQLQRAPQVIAAVQRQMQNLSGVRERISVLSTQLEQLYAQASAPTDVSTALETTILHVSDIHLNPVGVEITRDLATQFKVDGIIDSGDLTTFGNSIESRIADLIGDMPAPYYFVPGNHDSFETRQLLAARHNIKVLDGTTAEIAGVKVLGIADPTFTATNEVSTAQAEKIKRSHTGEVASKTAAEQPDILAVHDPIQAADVKGETPLVIAGHVHQRSMTSKNGTRILTVGSTGATGLGSFTEDSGRRYEAEILHLQQGRLTGIDYIEMDGVKGSFRVDHQTMTPIKP